MRSLNKIVLALLCCSVAGSCAILPREGTVNPEISNIYNSSVVIKDQDGKSFGSGTIIHSGVNQKMVVLTAAHVIEAMQKRKKVIKVTTAFDKIERIFEVLKMDSDKDLALIYSINNEKKRCPFVKIASRGPKIGDSVWVIGTPMGAERTVTNGIISNYLKEKKVFLYRSTAVMYYGNSGGGMFNSRGELVGVAHGVLTAQLNIFVAEIVPGGFFFIGLPSIKAFM